MNEIRIGHGYDVHRLTEGRKLILGGVEIPHTVGLLGHSDADVLLHAVMDALLGSIALGDIGKHFPDTDPKYKGIDSKILLKETYGLVKQKGYVIENIDTVLCLQKPKVAPYLPAMREVLSNVLGIPQDDISIKATTTEHLGFEGREEGVSAMASVLIKSE